jgi:phosphohistidine phosphatase SixA
MSAAGGGPARRRIFLVRHAHAGDRSRWDGDDNQRPLSDKGWRQAEGIAALLRDQPVDRVLSSPSLRCVQTVEPLARDRGMRIEEVDELLEGNDPAEALELLEAEQGSLVACTHGDIVPGVLDLLRGDGIAVDGAMSWPKGSTWVLEAGAGGEGFERARYLPPP